MLHDASVKIKIVLGFVLCILSGVIVLPTASFLILGANASERIYNLAAPRIIHLVSAGIAGLICGVIIMYWLVKKVVLDRLAEISYGVNELTSGNLQSGFPSASSDEIGQLSNNMNLMVAALSQMINKILNNAHAVVSTVDALRSSGDSLAQGAKEQSGQAGQIAVASEEMSHTIIDIAKNASSAAQTSSTAMDIASQGRIIAEGAEESVHKVSASALELSAHIDTLNSRVAEIGDIVSVIKGIADQTNLLALNAAIEAARAGEQGRGFAVVADEVRKLAERTIAATGEISEKIETVKTGSDQTTSSMVKASTDVSRAAEYIKKVGDSLNDIVNAVQKARDQVTQIAAAVEEQSAASEEIASNIEKTSGIAQSMEGLSRDVMGHVHGLIKIAEDLRASTEGFKTNGHDLMILDLAKTDHRVFVGKIAACIKGDDVLDPESLPDHHACRFGKWYDRDGKNTCGHLESYHSLKVPHETIHSLAKEAVREKRGGNIRQAEELYRQIEEASRYIGNLLDTLKLESSKAF